MPRDHVSAKAEGKSRLTGATNLRPTSPIPSAQAARSATVMLTTSAKVPNATLPAKAARRASVLKSTIEHLPVSFPSARFRANGSVIPHATTIARLPTQSFTDPATNPPLSSVSVQDRPADAVHSTVVNHCVGDGIGTHSTERADYASADAQPCRVGALSPFSERGDQAPPVFPVIGVPTFTPAPSEPDQPRDDTHRACVELAPLQQTSQARLPETTIGELLGSSQRAAGVGHSFGVTQRSIADGLVVSEFSQAKLDTQNMRAELAPQHRHTIDEIREQWRRRQSWHRAEKSLTLAAKAMCRRLVAKGEDKAELKEADSLYSAALGKGQHPLSDVAYGAIFPIIEARDGMEKHRKAVEKRLAKLAKTLPVAEFVETLRGVGIGSLAAIVGESGDLGSYANPAKLWKRMGLAVMPDGRQRKVAGAAAIAHGYSPQRRSVMWNIGDCIVKAGGPLRELYDARKLVEHQKAATEGLTVLPAGKIPKKDAERYRSEGHVHNRAKRYVEKRVLLLLWRAWRQMSY